MAGAGTRDLLSPVTRWNRQPAPSSSSEFQIPASLPLHFPQPTVPVKAELPGGSPPPRPRLYPFFEPLGCDKPCIPFGLRPEEQGLLPAATTCGSPPCPSFLLPSLPGAASGSFLY